MKAGEALCGGGKKEQGEKGLREVTENINKEQSDMYARKCTP